MVSLRVLESPQKETDVLQLLLPWGVVKESFSNLTELPLLLISWSAEDTIVYSLSFLIHSYFSALSWPSFPFVCCPFSSVLIYCQLFPIGLGICLRRISS